MMGGVVFSQVYEKDDDYGYHGTLLGGLALQFGDIPQAWSKPNTLKLNRQFCIQPEVP